MGMETYTVFTLEVYNLIQIKWSSIWVPHIKATKSLLVRCSTWSLAVSDTAVLYKEQINQVN